MTQNLLATLNEQQRAAVTHLGSPALVLAGAGSGKTRVLTTRAVWLTQEQAVDPSSIMLVTFTNKAANEMKKRIVQFTGSQLPWSGTFHSLCAKILRRDGHIIKLAPGYTIYDTDDQLALVKQLYKKHGFSTKDYNPRAIKAQISNAKNEMLDPDQYQALASGHFQEFTAKVYTLYETGLRDNQAVDFDDLLLLTIKLLKSDKALLNHYQTQIQHVLIDEYQDTNKAQYELTRLFARPQNNLFVVGDFAQSIYAWRGANYKNMLKLKQDFPTITEYRLERNYRSTQSILDAAAGVISQTDAHPVLELWTETPHHANVVCIETKSGDDEANKVVETIRSMSGFGFGDAAVLYRTNAQSRSFEEACVRHGVPYRLIGGFKFYERKEIKDLLSYLKVCINPSDDISKARCIKIGKRRFAAFEKWLESHPVEMRTELDPKTSLQEIIAATKYTDLLNDQDPEDIARLENIEELLSVAGQFQELSQFLENVALVQDNYFADVDPEQNEQEALTLMSLHSAKGLEFPVVFMVGMEEGLLPHSRSLLDKDQLEEERRLCYVGITRAQQHLYLTYARQRWQYGSKSYATRSRFIHDIPEEILTIQSAPYSSDERNNQAWGYNHRFKQKKPTTKPAARRVVVDDDVLDGILSGDVDIEAFLDS